MKQKTVLALAFLVLIIPFLGFPDSWKTLFSILIAIGLGYSAYSVEIKKFFTPRIHSPMTKTDTFVEGVPTEQK